MWLVVVWLASGGAVAQSVARLQQRADRIYRKQPRVALVLLARAERQARQQHQPDAEANCRANEATVYYKLYDDYDRAAAACQAGLRLKPLADSTRFKLLAPLQTRSYPSKEYLLCLLIPPSMFETDSGYIVLRPASQANL